MKTMFDIPAVTQQTHCSNFTR